MSLNFASNKKKISLGGRSKLQESREQILQRSQAEREKRARQRAEQKAVLLLQVFVCWKNHTCSPCLSPRRKHNQIFRSTADERLYLFLDLCKAEKRMQKFYTSLMKYALQSVWRGRQAIGRLKSQLRLQWISQFGEQGERLPR